MFGKSRQKVTEHIIAALRPIIGILQNYYGIPPGFWQERSVLGFFSFMLPFHRDITLGIRLSDEDRRHVMADVFTALSNMNGVAIARNVTALAMAQRSPSTLKRGRIMRPSLFSIQLAS